MTTPPGPVRPGHRVTADRLNQWLLPGSILFYGRRNATQAISSTSNPSMVNAIEWDETLLDTTGGWDAGEPTRWTCSIGGWHLVSGSVGFAASSSGSYRACAWYVNASLASGGHGTRVAPTSSGIVVADGRQLAILLSAGDYMQLIAAQDSGGNLDTSTGGARPTMQVTYAGQP